MAAKMEMKQQIKFIRTAQIDAEKAKLHSAQAKRMVPVLLNVENSLNDIT